jgi:outer membrane protein assembly factor BamB
MAGRGYYTAGGMIYCIDMRTGEQLWAVPGSFNTGAIRNRTQCYIAWAQDSLNIMR